MKMPHAARTFLIAAAMAVGAGAHAQTPLVIVPAPAATPSPTLAPALAPAEPPLSRTETLMQLQLHTAQTQPAPPPMTGPEAAAVYRGYMDRRGGARPADTTAAANPFASALQSGAGLPGAMQGGLLK